MGITAIEWTGTRRPDGALEPGYSWSPWWGCTRVSAGCAHCYAADIAQRFRGLEYRRGVPRQLTKDWEKPLAWDRKARRYGIRRKVFPSMCDIFDDEVPPEWRVRFFHLVSTETRNLDWLILTKRPENIRRFHGNGTTPRSWPETMPPNVWLGVSVENQQMADERIPLLLQTLAAVRFLSVEPLLAPVNLTPWFVRRGTPVAGCTWKTVWEPQKLHWIICGGESGKHYRPCDVPWISDLARQCRAAGVACFIKQDAHRLPGQQGRLSDELWALKEFPK